MASFFKNFHVTHIISIVFLFLLTSCATVLEQTPQNYVPTQSAAVIFGKSEFIFNGKILPYDGRKMLIGKKIILHHITKYSSKNSLNSNAFAPGDYGFQVTYDEKGYFAYILPPGKYYFTEFGYINIIPDRVNNILGIRTYTKIPYTTIGKPYLITFEILPNSSTYIGTIRHHFDTMKSNYFQSEHTWFIDIADEYEDAKQWFLTSRNGLQGQIIKRIADVDYDIH